MNFTGSRSITFTDSIIYSNYANSCINAESHTIPILLGPLGRSGMHIFINAAVIENKNGKAARVKTGIPRSTILQQYF